MFLLSITIHTSVSSCFSDIEPVYSSLLIGIPLWISFGSGSKLAPLDLTWYIRWSKNNLGQKATSIWLVLDRYFNFIKCGSKRQAFVNSRILSGLIEKKTTTTKLVHGLSSCSDGMSSVFCISKRVALTDYCSSYDVEWRNSSWYEQHVEELNAA